MAPVLNRSPLAACSFKTGNGSHIRVYYQDTQGNIKESCYDTDKNWFLGAGIGAKGKLNTGIACCVWDNGSSIRVYYLNHENRICERMFTNGIWKDGELTTGSNKFFAAPHSQLSVISYMPGIDAIHLFYQDSNHKICEIMYTSSWKAGTNALPMAAAGTSLSACALQSQPGYMWLYCQDTDMKPIEMQYQGGNWFKGTFAPTGVYSPGASISAIMHSKIEIRVICVTEDNRMSVTSNTNEKWTGTTMMANTITNSPLAAVIVAGTSEWLRVYYMSSGSQISEYGSEDGHSWVQKAPIIPTAN